MPTAYVNGRNINYTIRGSGDTVILIMGTGGNSRSWDAFQVPDLLNAGYRVITFDNRGIPVDKEVIKFTVGDMAQDVIGLITTLDASPCRVIGYSFGAQIAQEVITRREDLIHSVILVGAQGRSDVFRRAYRQSHIEFYDSGVDLPPLRRAVIQAQENFSPNTLNNADEIQNWLEILQLYATTGPGLRAQLEASSSDFNNLEGLRALSVPTLVVAFSDDRAAPPHLGREVAEAIPGAVFEEIPNCGHLGFAEDPAALNDLMLKFLQLPASIDSPGKVVR